MEKSKINLDEIIGYKGFDIGDSIRNDVSSGDYTAKFIDEETLKSYEYPDSRKENKKQPKNK